MTMHKTILTLLLTMLAVIGTTATVAHAEGPVVDEGGGTTQVPRKRVVGTDGAREARRRRTTVRILAPARATTSLKNAIRSGSRSIQ